MKWEINKNGVILTRESEPVKVAKVYDKSQVSLIVNAPEICEALRMLIPHLKAFNENLVAQEVEQILARVDGSEAKS